MPDLSQDFASAYLNAVTFALRCRDRGRDPFKQGVALTVSNIEKEQLVGDRGKKSDRWVMYFREWQQGLPLSRPHFNVIAQMHGTDSDDWTDIRLRFVLVEGEGARGAPAIRVVPEKLPGAYDPMGEKMIASIEQRAQKSGTTLDAFVEFAKERDEELYAAIADKPRHQWVHLIGVEIGRWLERIEHPDRFAHEQKKPRVQQGPKPGAAPRSPVPAKVGDTKPGALPLDLGDEDIPF